MALLFQETLDACVIDDNIRCIYLTGAGKAFCAGQDLEEVTIPGGPGMDKILNEQFNPIILRIQNMQKPVIAAVTAWQRVLVQTLPSPVML
jgi:2-(1,2-epoxy-1,2-dihydrophenyl)acetyl-CoA isomerase